MPHINDAGLTLLESFEGERLRSYPDCASPLACTGSGSGDPWTIGYGHTAAVHPGQTITHAQAVAFLRADVGAAEMAIARAVQLALNPNQFSALVCWQYNTGAIAGSPLAARINANDFAGAMTHLQRYVYAQGQILQGLVRRRAAERALFETHG